MKLALPAMVIPLMLIIPAFLAAPAAADRMGVPFDSNVEFDESAQNAIAAWNGQKECLILSTDISSRVPGRLLEVLPLPSAPYDIRTGNISSFKTIIGLYNEKMRRLDISPVSENVKLSAGSGGSDEQEFQGIEVVFSASVGLHDITVVKIESADHFLQWARDFADARGVADFSIDARLNATVSNYLDRNIPYFVFDIVNATSEKRTAEPLVYLFNTSYLYYPLNDTYGSLPEREDFFNEISVFLIADGVLRSEGHYLSGVHFSGGVSEYIEMTRSELGRVSGSLGPLFERSAFVAHLSGRMYAYDHSPDGVKDIILNPGDFRRPTDAEMQAQYARGDFLRAIKPLSPSLAYYMLRSLYDPGYAPPAPYLALILLGIFIGPVALAFMYRSMVEGRAGRTPYWIVWLTLYSVGTGLVVVFSVFAMPYSVGGAWLFFLFPAVLVPLVLVHYLRSRFKARPAAGKHTVFAICFGMALAQVLAFVFIPNSLVAVPVDIVCFPFLGIAGLILVPASLLMRRRRPAQPGGSPPPPLAR